MLFALSGDTYLAISGRRCLKIRGAPSQISANRVAAPPKICQRRPLFPASVSPPQPGNYAAAPSVIYLGPLEAKSSENASNGHIKIPLEALPSLPTSAR